MAATTTKKAPASVVELEFVFDHDTKGAMQFKQVDDGSGGRPLVGTLYLTKEGIAKTGLKGKRLLVTIEDA